MKSISYGIQDEKISCKIIVKICKGGNSVDVFLNIAEEKFDKQYGMVISIIFREKENHYN